MNNYSPTASEEGRIIERIRIAYIRNMGNLIDVIKEVNLPAEYVEKIVIKFRKESKTDTKRLVANTILEHLILGYEKRVQNIKEVLNRAEGQENNLRSSCHQDHVRKLEPVTGLEGVDLGELKEHREFECLKCGELCDVYAWINEDALSLKLQAVDSLRKEDENLIKFLEKLGYTEKKEQPPQTIIENQNIVVMPNAKGEINPEDMKNIQALRPMEQECLRLNIEKTLLEAEISDEPRSEEFPENNPK